MKIKMIKTGEVLTVESAYGVRLIEQGQATVAAEARTAEARTAEKKPAAKAGK